MTKQLNLKLVLTILVSMMGMNAYSYDACIDGIYYNFNGDNAIVTHQHPTNSSNDYKGAVVIPSSVHYNSKDYSVTSIDEDAFNMCSGLTSITIPSSVTNIEENAFSGCSSLTTITIPSSVTSIGDYAFSGCTGLTTITIPNSVQTLGNNIVSGCIGLNSINVDAGNSIYDSRGNCNAIILTATNTLIAGCKSTVIPNTVTSIGFEAFYFCSSLTTITIPNSVLTIGNNAFHGCSGLTSVKLYAETPAPLLSGIFPTSQPMTLYVPQGSKAAYQSASGWMNFRTIIEFDPSFTLTANDLEMEYGDAVPAFTYTTEGETFRGTPQFTCDATSASPVGTYPIVVGRGTIDNDHGTYVNGTLTIEKAPLTITAKSYSIKQGDALPTFEIEYSGFKNDESLSVLTTKSSITCNATSESEPGTYDIIVSGAAAQNYSFTYVKGTLTITQANPVTVTAKSYSRQYGEANPAFEYTSSGAALSGTPSITCEATATSPVGEYPIVIAKGTVTNYNDTYVNGKLTVTKAPLTITAKNYAIKQGDAMPTFEIEYSGFKNSETSSVLATQPTITCNATSASEPGTYDIIVSGADAANYGITYVKGTLTITQADEVVVAANSYIRLYGEANPIFGYFSFGTTLSGEPDITCEATATSPVGEYDIVPSKGTITNYNVTYVNGKLIIGKTPLTITAKSYTIKQGEALPSFEAEYSGFKNDETSQVLTTQPAITTTATSASAPGTYDIVVSGADATNYDIAYVKGTLTITQADPVTVTAKSYTRLYGEANPAFEYTSSGAALSGTPSITCAATTTSPVGDYPIVIAKGTVTNYNDTYVNGKLTIEKAPLTITAKSYSIKQGDALPTFEAEYSGFKNSETSSVLTTKPTITCTATSASEPGTYDIIVSGATAANYDITYVKGTLTITDADKIVIAANSYCRLYGDANPSFGYVAFGTTLSGEPDITCEAIATSPVGEYDIVASKGTVTNYNDTYVKGKLIIIEAPLTITAKNYTIKQGETLPTFEADYSGFKNSETSSVLTTQPIITTTATSASEPGTYDIVVSGAAATNYDITYVKGTLTIIQADPVTITAKSYTIHYGDELPTFEFDSEGATLKGTPAISCEATKTSAVSTYPIVITKGSVTNYNTTFVNGKLTITKAPLTITAKSYTIKQGETLPTFEAAYDGFKNSQTSSVLTTQPSISCSATSASAPGTYDIVVSEAAATNYDIIYVKGTLTITQADPVTVVAKSYSRQYGEANPAFEYTSSGAALSGTPSITCAATTTSPVGEYDIVASKGTVTNYNDTYVKGKLIIIEAPLTITAKNYTIKQGETLPTFEVEYSGFKNGETKAVLTTLPTISCSATSASEPGTYEIVVSGADAANYSITYVKGTLTITQADEVVVAAYSFVRLYGDANPTFGYFSFGTALSGKPDITCEAIATSPVGEYGIVPSKGTITNNNVTYVNGKLAIIEAPLTITAKSYTIKQGETLPTFEATYEGFKNSETSSVLTTQPIITTTATSASEPGTYDIVVSGAAATNYDITYVKGTLTITQADPVTITTKSYTINYGDGLPTFEFTSEGATLKGTPAITCEATKTSAVGTYPIGITKGSVTNYNTTFVNGKLTITKAPLTITAKSYTIKQGETLPTFEATYEGFKNNETSQVLTKQPVITTTATSTSAPGTYDIVVSGATAANYDIIYVKGTLTITQVDLVTVIAKSYSRQYGEANPAFEYTSSGAALNGTPSLTCAATATSPVSEYDIVANKGTVTNHNLALVNGKLTVTKAPLTITAKNYAIKQGETLPTFEIEYSGFKNGETSSVLATQPTITCSASSSSAPGTYDIVVSGADAANYSITYVKGTLTITQADEVVVAAYSFVRLYGDANPPFGYFTFGAALSGEPSITCEATATSPVGEYDIVPSKGTITNYNVTYVNGELMILQAPLTITAKSYTIKQGEAMPTFEVEYSGFKNDETKAVLATQPTISCSATSASAPGTYDIVVSGADATNYDIAYVKGTLTITQADPVTITAKSYTIQYGDELPTFEFTSEGATLEGKPAVTCEATTTSAVGTYPIVITKGSVTNYNTTFVSGTLTITKAPLTITAKSCTIKQGEALPTFEATYEGFKNNETSQVLTKQPAIITTATSSSEPGEYDITISGAEAQNYDISYVAGKLTITASDGIKVISFEHPVSVFNLSGHKVRSNVTSLEGLPKGVYIINGKKVAIK